MLKKIQLVLAIRVNSVNVDWKYKNCVIMFLYEKYKNM